MATKLCAKIAPSCEKVAEKPRKTAQDAPKTAPEAPKYAPRPPKVNFSARTPPPKEKSAAWAQHCGPEVLATEHLENVSFAKAGCIFEDFASAGGRTKGFLQKHLH